MRMNFSFLDVGEEIFEAAFQRATSLPRDDDAQRHACALQSPHTATNHRRKLKMFTRVENARVRKLRYSPTI
jgi:hypothetical protein